MANEEPTEKVALYLFESQRAWLRRRAGAQHATESDAMRRFLAETIPPEELRPERS